MYIRVRVDGKGRITLPKKIRKKMGIKKGDELMITLEREKLLISKIEDPFKILEKTFKDITFSRKLREIAEKEALKELK